MNEHVADTSPYGFGPFTMPVTLSTVALAAATRLDHWLWRVKADLKPMTPGEPMEKPFEYVNVGTSAPTELATHGWDAYRDRALDAPMRAIASAIEDDGDNRFDEAPKLPEWDAGNRVDDWCVVKTPRAGVALMAIAFMGPDKGKPEGQTPSLAFYVRVGKAAVQADSSQEAPRA